MRLPFSFRVLVDGARGTLQFTPSQTPYCRVLSHSLPPFLGCIMMRLVRLRTPMPHRTLHLPHFCHASSSRQSTASIKTIISETCVFSIKTNGKRLLIYPNGIPRFQSKHSDVRIHLNVYIAPFGIVEILSDRSQRCLIFIDIITKGDQMHPFIDIIVGGTVIIR